MSLVRKDVLAALTNLVLKTPSVALFGLPGVGKTHFLKQWKEEIEKSNPKLFPIFPASQNSGILHEIDPNKKSVVIIDETVTDLESLEQIKLQLTNVSFVVSCSDLFKTGQFDNLKDLEELTKNVIYLQPFDFFDHKQYLTGLINETVFTLTKFQIEDMYNLCGGHPILTKTFIRSAVEKSRNLNWEKFKEEALNLPDFLEINKRIWKSLTDEERTILLASFKRINIQKHEAGALEKLEKKGVIRRRGANFQMFSKLFENYIRKYGEMKILPDGIILDDKSKRVFRDGEEITGLLSANEYYLLEIFTRNRNLVISREEIKTLVNKRKNGELISDEALDQVIVRLRNKIEKDRHNPQKLLTIRGRGFQFRS